MLVYKYRGGAFERDLKSLKNNEFWASNTKQLNDPCEGLITSSAYQQQINVLKDIFPQNKNNITLIEQCLKNIIDMKDSKLGIFSLSRRYDDELLWAHYADSHNGFCIEYDLERLLSNQNPRHRFFDVQYTNSIPNLDLSNIINQNDSDKLIRIMLGFKSQRWEYENELRIITENQGLTTYDFRAVKAIYFGLKTPKEDIELLMQALQGRKIKYFQMQLKPNSFELEAKQIKDKFPTSVKYKYSIAPISKLAVDPSTLKLEYQKFSPYLQKLAEIIRREPDCYEVDYIDISLSKSTLDNPIFFAQYRTQEDVFFTQTVHYTTYEIDTEYDQIDDL
ncbi:hypothetical protein GCM10025882_20180 [Acinetobacter gyllenbergii]|uniref:DUF2971 domain-containing protein n=2 Tax=Acinetobacter gyllenbergii TaxID=134534 RepID=A0A829HHP3_9GAMM|nr:DUF2971 domain-containing protein [Acinetobacter gyllenbergii]EPF79609.1 hypothetical protein F957_02475 [Acinetobacter gyllenbergii CIP 110306 = MTCC 11365]EPH32860.1 hypothetical protein L293_1037 [Acinetobacter gyllenbergii CIP 110306 = MTCC 11365]ESK50101.1 hypothetical protein F987_01647 [Acinetobacter gyllenbergii NIPH 230]GMA11593.1 hypothetical protein GCM10025882_20180 [Acinetobacter gyllenbergii]